MRILVLGSGAREHALVTALAAEGAHRITAAPGNPGIGAEAEVLSLDVADPQLVSEFAADEGVELVVIGPEAPLVAGVADAVRAAGIPVFGPDRAAAALEGSKTFAKEVMSRAQVPTGGAQLASTVEEVERALDAFGTPYVVKADGLAAGKGVLVTSDRAEAVQHAERWLPVGPVLVEEFLDGQEVSVFVLSDGEHVRALPPAQDFKRLGDGDTGPNTGGMGAYTPVPFLTARFGSEDAFSRAVLEQVAQPVVDELRANGSPFVGLLYCGLIVTDAGIRVIEFNARFGDPETQAVLTRLDAPLSELLFAAATGRLGDAPDPLPISPRAAVTLVLASEGYPEQVQTGRHISGTAAVDRSHDGGVRVLHAATARDGDALVATGGRVLNVVATGDTLADARALAYEGLEAIELPGGVYRTDIARAAAEAEAGR
ncbi:phosphoribosylamine--glycine ligase [Pseudoclavibacter chungangensis]|uniref:Phosphoribosylamine--glycine ligase n=1 Tax=Pseudoclavibacter chungangensis TaxID=587635 RepID=A0A7J5C1K5_9MICO|nr:phosphoribosylamine--glycine ligase [Pseudoclavibacter chungangensis]KAB1662526.1 phosphoribosylamine--glycine ligase [Pseudoclavibacter chungangensis]NYJ68565.1 phosphoribosylamine--glycine ligase [Pseudoclavibacter chungangensis]